MKVKEKTINPVALSVILILLIMMVSVFFRVMTARTVYRVLGENYIDSETGVPYLTEMDSYYHLRMTRDLMDYGHAGEELKEGEPWDSLSYAPSGRSASDYKPLMATIAISVNRLISVFVPMSLEQTV